MNPDKALAGSFGGSRAPFREAGSALSRRLAARPIRSMPIVAPPAHTWNCSPPSGTSVLSRQSVCSMRPSRPRSHRPDPPPARLTPGRGRRGGRPPQPRPAPPPPPHLVDDRLVRIKRGRPRRKLLARLRPDRVHGLLRRPPRHVVLALKLAHLHASTMITPDRRVQLDLGNLRHGQDLSPGAPDAALASTPVLSKLN